MAATVVLLVILALVVYGIERNHAREKYPHPSLDGSGAVTDRDVQRTRADLDALGAEPADRTEHAEVPAHRAAPARSAHAGVR
jgi:hypothetical protein